jgi:hypothetical protein
VRPLRRQAASIALLVAFLSLAGCSSGGDESAPPSAAASGTSEPTQAMIAWVGKVCAADQDLQSMQHATRIAALSYVSRRPTRKQITNFVAVTYRDLQEEVERFEQIGKAPVDGGDQVVAAYVTALKTALTKAGKAKESLADRRGSPDWFVSGFPQDLADARESVVPRNADLPSLLARNVALGQAYKAAPSCKRAAPLTAKPSPTPTS